MATKAGDHSSIFPPRCHVKNLKNKGYFFSHNGREKRKKEQGGGAMEKAYLIPCYGIMGILKRKRRKKEGKNKNGPKNKCFKKITPIYLFFIFCTLSPFVLNKQF